MDMVDASTKPGNVAWTMLKRELRRVRLLLFVLLAVQLLGIFWVCWFDSDELLWWPAFTSLCLVLVVCHVAGVFQRHAKNSATWAHTGVLPVRGSNYLTAFSRVFLRMILALLLSWAPVVLTELWRDRDNLKYLTWDEVGYNSLFWSYAIVLIALTYWSFLYTTSWRISTLLWVIISAAAHAVLFFWALSQISGGIHGGRQDNSEVERVFFIIHWSSIGSGVAGVIFYIIRCALSYPRHLQWLAGHRKGGNSA